MHFLTGVESLRFACRKSPEIADFNFSLFNAIVKVLSQFQNWMHRTLQKMVGLDLGLYLKFLRLRFSNLCRNIFDVLMSM